MWIFERWRMWHIHCMFHVLGLINTRVIKANVLYGNPAFRALQSRYLSLFLYIHAYYFREGSKILSRPEDRIKLPMSLAILSVNCLLIPLGVKRNTHYFHTTIPAIRCVLLVMLRRLKCLNTDADLKASKGTHKWFLKISKWSRRSVLFEFLKSHCLILWKLIFPIIRNKHNR